MLTPLNWLREFIDINESDQDIIEKLTTHSCEIEKIIPQDNTTILDLDVLPNRGDLTSIRGIARECSVMYEKPLKEPDVYSGPLNGIKNPDKLNIKNQAPELCKRYLGIKIKDVVIKDSPDWIKKKLTQAGLNSINNIIDITNLVLLEMGQPLHAFSRDKVANDTIIIHKACDGEKLKTLNNDDLTLTSEQLIISDEEKPIALAGIIGGLSSSIHEDTTEIFLESAYFDPTTVRKTAFKTAIRTDSSQRFEKGVDINGVELGLRRAIYLILKYADGKIASNLIDIVDEKLFIANKIKFRSERINKLLGSKASEEEMLDILNRLGFTREGSMIIVPSYRQNDVTREADLVEEVGKFLGFNQIKSEMLPVTQFKPKKELILFDFNNLLRNALINYGCNEIVSYSMADPYSTAKATSYKTVEIKNPLSTSESILRPSLFVSLFKNLIYNYKNLQQNLNIFEIGKIFYKPDNKTLIEKSHTGVLFFGHKESTTAQKQAVEFTLFDLKGILTDLLNSFKIKDYQFVNGTNCKFLHPFRCGQVLLGNESIAMLGEVHPEYRKEYNISRPAYYLELYNEELLELVKTSKGSFKQFSLYPIIKRDTSFWIDKSVDYSRIFDTIKKCSVNNLKSVELIEIYNGDKHGQNKINYTLSVTFQAADKTLTDDIVQDDFQKIISKIEKKLPIIFA